MNTTPLAGLRVLDFSHALAGPYCTLLLSDFGADVYKLESPSAGDMGRGWGPPFCGTEASFFLGLNRGKKGVSIDLKKPAGLELCLRLIEKMDAVVENFRPGTMDRLGLGYAAASSRNPGLIYCSISGYGQDGPSRDEAAMDLIVQASSGLLSITGTEAGEQVRCGYSVADVTSGLFAVIGILMALQARARTGRGQYIDVSMLDSMISTMSSNYMQYLGSGRDPRPLGSSFSTVVPYTVFAGSNGKTFAIAVGSEKLWSTFCSQVIERPELENDPLYANNAVRCENRPALEAILKHIFLQKSSGEWLERLLAAGIPASPVRTFSEVVGHPQSAVREMFPVLEHRTAGSHRVTGTPLKLSETPGRPTTAAPLKGEHTLETLKTLLDLTSAEISELEAQAVLFDSKAPGTV